MGLRASARLRLARAFVLRCCVDILALDIAARLRPDPAHLCRPLCTPPQQTTKRNFMNEWCVRAMGPMNREFVWDFCGRLCTNTAMDVFPHDTSVRLSLSLSLSLNLCVAHFGGIFFRVHRPSFGRLLWYTRFRASSVARTRVCSFVFPTDRMMLLLFQAPYKYFHVTQAAATEAAY